MDRKLFDRLRDLELQNHRLRREYRLLQKAHMRGLRREEYLKKQLNQNVERIPIVPATKPNLPK